MLILRIKTDFPQKHLPFHRFHSILETDENTIERILARDLLFATLTVAFSSFQEIPDPYPVLGIDVQRGE